MIPDFSHSPDDCSRPLHNVRSFDDISVRRWPPATLCQRPSTAESSSWHGTTSAEIIADLGNRLEASKQEIRDLNETLERTRERAAKLIGKLLRQKRDIASALEKSETQREDETKRQQDTAEITRLAWDRFCEWTEIEADEHHDRPPVPCMDCSKAHADRSKTEREAKDLRLELGHANKRLEYERDASSVIARQAENYQRLVDLQHGEIKDGKAKLGAMFVVVEKLKRENQELLEREKKWSTPGVSNDTTPPC